MNKPRSVTDAFSNRRKTIQFDEIQGTGFVSKSIIILSNKMDKFLKFQRSNILDVKRGNASSYNTLARTNEAQANSNSMLLKDVDLYKQKYIKSEENCRILETKYEKIKIEYWNLKREHENLLQEFNKRVSSL